MRSLISRLLSSAALAVAGAALLPNAACVGKSAFRCTSNSSCIAFDGTPGICESNASCSFADSACADSGRRYADGVGATSACVTAAPEGKCVANLSLGTSHTCAVRTDGTVWCWGDNSSGQLGDGTTTPRAAPTRAQLPAGVKAALVTTGESHTCALATDGTVWCWGGNDTHQLGVAGADGKTPVQVPFMAAPAPAVATSLSAGGKHTCAVVAKALYCWGENSDGQSGKDPAAFDDVATPTAIDGISGVVQAGSGDEFSCALKDDKSVWCWGANSSGELGNGTTTPSFAPVKVTLASAGSLAVGDEFACALKDDGTVWCWGYGQSGNLGVGSTSDQHTPVPTTTAKTVSASGQSFHACALAASGALSCWGANDAAQLGAGKTDAKVPLPSTVNLVTVTTVALGGKHTCAVTLDGALWCWGGNDVGQLGLGSAGGPEGAPRRVPFSCAP